MSFWQYLQTICLCFLLFLAAYFVIGLICGFVKMALDRLSGSSDYFEPRREEVVSYRADQPRVAGITTRLVEGKVFVWLLLENGKFYRWNGESWCELVNLQFLGRILQHEQVNERFEYYIDPQTQKAIKQMGFKI